MFPPDSIWTAYPFFLPNLMVASLQLFALVFTFLFLEETHPHLQVMSDLGLTICRTIAGRLSQRGHEHEYEMVYSNQEGADSAEILDIVQEGT